MLILQPTNDVKIINIAPRKSTIEGDYVLTIRRDGDGLEEVINDAVLNNLTNFVEVIFVSTMLTEDSTYSLEITNDGKLWYRDKIYVTTQTKSDIENNKHEIGGGNIYKPYSTVNDDTYIVGGDTGGGDTGGGTELTDTLPLIKAVTYGNNYITLNEEFLYQIIATNTPTSYDAYPLPDGLVIDTVSGVISGNPFGDERVEAVTLSATNEYGTTTRNIDFYLTYDSADDFLAPYDFIAANDTEDGFLLRWYTKPYNRVISASEVYKNGLLVTTIYHTDRNQYGVENKYVFTGIDGNYPYKVRLINSAGEFSPFSEDFYYNIPSLKGALLDNESIVKTNPTMDNVVAYYKLDSITDTVLIDETSVNNGTIVGTAPNKVDGLIGDAVDFNASLLQQGVVSSSASLSFGSGTGYDSPFSVSLWFKGDGGSTTFPLMLKENEWQIFVNEYQGVTKYSFSLRDVNYSPIRSRVKVSFLDDAPVANEWQHLVVTFDGDAFYGDSMDIFIDNKYINNEMPINSTFNNPYNKMRITNSELFIGNDNRFDSYRQQTIVMDEVVVFNKELTKDEINFLYNDGLGNSLT